MKRSVRQSSTRSHSRSNVFLASALVLTALTTIGPGTADAGDVTIEISQSTDLAWDGQDIDVTFTGTTPGINFLAICPTEFAASGVEFDIASCTQLEFAAPAPPFSRTFNVRHDTHSSCATNGCSLTLVSVIGFPVTDAEIYFEPLSFGPPPPVPPTDPNFAMTVETITDSGVELEVGVRVANRNPATVSATLSFCPAEFVAGDDHVACNLLQTFNANADANADFATLVILGRQGLPGRDCQVDPCALVYEARGTATRPVTEFAKQTVNFLPAPAITSISGNLNIRSWSFVDFTWEAQNSDQIPLNREIAGPSNYIGLCLGDVPDGLPYSDDVCMGSDLGPDAFAGETRLIGQRFITTERDGVVDCLEYSAGCVVGYSLSYVDLESGNEVVVLDRDDRPLTFEQSVTVNFGSQAIPVGEPVSVSSFGLPTGAAGFLMMCAIGDRGGLDLRCSDDLGTVIAPFEGELFGTITMPAAIEVDGETFDCTIGRGCLIVLAVIGEDLQLAFGSGTWIRALGDFAITVTPSTDLEPSGETVLVETVNARNNFATVLMLCPNDVEIPAALGEISGRCLPLDQWLQVAPVSAEVVVVGNDEPRCAIVGCSMVWATYGVGFQLTAAASAPVTFAF